MTATTGPMKAPWTEATTDHLGQLEMLAREVSRERDRTQVGEPVPEGDPFLTAVIKALTSREVYLAKRQP